MTEQSYICRLFTDNVLQALSDIHAEAFQAMDERPWRPQEFLSLIEMPGVVVRLTDDGTDVAGYILYRSVADEAELITVALRPGYQGRGIAAGLMHDMIRDLAERGVEKIFLEVREDNERALKLYKDFAFTTCGKRPDYYQTQSGKRFDALCLCLIVNKSLSEKKIK